MQEAKQGCLLGCAGLATLLVIAAAGLLIYVATHREEWGLAVAAQTRAFVEEGTRRHFPVGVSQDAIQRLGETVERGQLHGHPSKENLERLTEILSRIEQQDRVGAKDWAEYLLTLLETLYEGLAPTDRLAAIASETETFDPETFDAEKGEAWIDRLTQAVEPGRETVSP